MSQSALLITVRLPGGRYHGLPEWPPSPFRLYQALIAGALLGEPQEREEEISAAFEWFERLDPPSVTVPAQTRGASVRMFMPNNDIDTVGGDPKRVAEIRGATKQIHPRLFAAPDMPLAYLWRFHDDDRKYASTIADLALRLYRFGRGVDMAYASGEVLSETDADASLAAPVMASFSPSYGKSQGANLRSAKAGSFRSLLRRHHAQQQRLRDGHLTQAPPPIYGKVSYNARSRCLLFDLMSTVEGVSRFHPMPLPETLGLVEQVRDRLAAVLQSSFGRGLVERVVIGRNAREADKAARLQIIPIPSIGSDYADHAIRRVLVVVPLDCPIPASEIEWAVGAVHLGVTLDGELVDRERPQLVRATDGGMLTHYGIHRGRGAASPVWRTVTPMVVPMRPLPARRDGSNRKAHEVRVAGAVRNALRQAGIANRLSSVQVQRESFEGRGTRADNFKVPNRLSGRGRYHVELRFAEPLEGPIAIGDGRYVGLGLFAPVRETRRDAFVFSLPPEARIELRGRPDLLMTTRHALMSLAADRHGNVPKLFSGHEPDGEPASSGRHEHIFLVADDEDEDGFLDRLLIIAPWLGDRECQPREIDRRRFDRVVSSLAWLGGKRLQAIRLPSPSALDQNDSLLSSAYAWESRTAYRPTIHPKRGQETQMIARDVANECARRGLPRPEVEILDHEVGPRGGRVSATLRLHFAVAVDGPILLGRESHSGMGLFKAKSPSGN